MSRDSLRECFLLVPELAAAREFYESVLGLSVADADDQSATYEVGAVTFKLQADYPPEVFEAFNLEAPAETDRGEGAFFAVELDDDLDAVHRRVADSDGAALIEPQSVDWLDSRMFIVQDPYGYTLELREQTS